MPNHFLFICDADTVIADNWMVNAKRVLATEEPPDAIGSVFFGGEHNGSMLQICQSLEWIRYTNQILRSKKVFVLTGTASLIRAECFERIYELRGYYYNEQSITEDFTMTLDLKEVGTKMVSPLSCSCLTEMMPSWKLLFLQRRRWYLGALQQIVQREWTQVMRPYLFQQLLLLISVFSFMLMILFSIYLAFTGDMIFDLFWAMIGIIFMAERITTVWTKGWHARLFAALMIPELIYSFILQISYLDALRQLLMGSKGSWNHV